MTLVCSLTSWYHHLGLIAYILDNDIKVKNLILIKSSFFGKIMPYETEALSLLSENIFYLNDIADLHTVFEDHSPDYVYLFSSNPYPYKLAKALSSKKIQYKVVEVEEGLGSYRGIIGELKASFLLARAEHNFIFSMHKLIIKLLILIVKKLWFKNIAYESWLNFDHRGEIADIRVNESYRKALAYLHKTKKVELGVEIEKDDCLIIGSPFVELRMINEEQYICRLKEVGKNYNKVFIKPHPIEEPLKYENLGFKIINPLLPVERLVHNIDKEAHIYAFSTTSTYTLNLFFGLQTRRIADLDCLFSKLTTEQKNIIRKYSKEY